MPARALSTARTVTVAALAATALGTATLGVHLATDRATAGAAGVSPSSRTPQQAEPRQREDGGVLGFSGFGLVQPPGAGGGGAQTRTHGS